MYCPPADPIVLPAASGLLIGGLALVKGFTVRNTSTTAAARFTLHDGGSATGLFLVECVLATTESARDWFTEFGIVAERGVWFNLDAGTVEGSAYIVPGENVPAGVLLGAGEQ